ncbi:MAG: hypothetical protein LBH77_02105, partial [Tannerella sp.]|nr:hypothetical protein [Tannerella sp.]
PQDKPETGNTTKHTLTNPAKSFLFRSPFQDGNPAAGSKRYKKCLPVLQLKKTGCHARGRIPAGCAFCRPVAYDRQTNGGRITE